MSWAPVAAQATTVLLHLRDLEAATKRELKATGQAPDLLETDFAKIRDFLTFLQDPTKKQD